MKLNELSKLIDELKLDNFDLKFKMLFSITSSLDVIFFCFNSLGIDFNKSAKKLFK